MRHWLLLFFLLAAGPSATVGQVIVHKQRHFGRQIPAGDYSGIACLGDNRYAVVDDKSESDGFHLMKITLDGRGRIASVRHEGFRSSGLSNRDGEGIAYMPSSSLLYISGEGDGQVLEYRIDGAPTGRRVQLPPMFRNTYHNRGLEALTCDTATGTLWMTTECALKTDGAHPVCNLPEASRLRLLQADADGRIVGQYAYLTDRPRFHRSAAQFAAGVSALAAVGDGRLLVLEREVYVPKKKVGASVRCRIYVVNPAGGEAIDGDAPLNDDAPFLQKQLLCEWKTRLSLTSRSFANYEGMCLGPSLADGRRVLLLVSDSQHRYRGVLRDWFRSVVFR